MLKLKFLYFDHLMRRTDSLEKTPMLGKIEGRRRRGWQRMRWMDSIPTRWTWVWASSREWWRTGPPGMLQSMGSQRVRHNWATELNWSMSQLLWYSQEIFLAIYLLGIDWGCWVQACRREGRVTLVTIPCKPMNPNSLLLNIWNSEYENVYQNGKPRQWWYSNKRANFVVSYQILKGCISWCGTGAHFRIWTTLCPLYLDTSL